MLALWQIHFLKFKLNNENIKPKHIALQNYTLKIIFIFHFVIILYRSETEAVKCQDKYS